MKYIYPILLAPLLFLGCATAGKMNKLSIGMTKSQALAVLGKPDSVSATTSTEYLNYSLYDTPTHADQGRSTQYFVRIIDDKVESFGRAGDFDSARTPTFRVETEHIVSRTGDRIHESVPKSELSGKLKELKSLRDEGTISAKEYSDEKRVLIEKWRAK